MKSKEMVEGDAKKIERAKRETKDGIDKEPIKEGVFNSPLLLVCVLGFLNLYSFGFMRK